MPRDDDALYRVRELLSLGADKPHTVAVLTDEELVALEQTEPGSALSTPWLDETPSIHRDAIKRFGARSLFVRGLLPARKAATASEPPLDIAPDVRLVLDLRKIGLGYVRATRSGAATSKLAVVQPELGVLEEEISAYGFHLFSACNYADALARIARWCLPLDLHLAGGTIELETKDWPRFLHADLPDALVTDLSVEIYLPDASGGREPEHWLIAYSSTVSILAQPSGGDRLTVRPVTSQRLYDLLGDRIATALQYAHGAE